jgi:nitrate/TMAO reductase-like tetraheme cytochrome c subunit
MSAKGLFHWFFIAALAGTFTLLAMWTAPAHAQSATPPAEPKCIHCHEDLYFLHDTGKWFCLNDGTPMTCVDCHGGNPTALTQEAAHANRAAYPVVNENIRKCQECHPQQASERVDIFGHVAGIGTVMVLLPYQPVIAAKTEVIPVTGSKQNENWILAIDTGIFILIAVLALTAYFVYRIRHGSIFHS